MIMKFRRSKCFRRSLLGRLSQWSKSELYDVIETLLDKDQVEMKDTLVGIANTKFSEQKSLVSSM